MSLGLFIWNAALTLLVVALLANVSNLNRYVDMNNKID